MGGPFDTPPPWTFSVTLEKSLKSYEFQFFDCTANEISAYFIVGSRFIVLQCSRNTLFVRAVVEL